LIFQEPDKVEQFFEELVWDGSCAAAKESPAKPVIYPE
jgi:hypothetical protein